jgi:signal transduction histidine kinase
MADAPIDFRLLFEESADVLLVLLPDAPRFTQVAATKARLRVTQTTLEQTLGVGIFELFPDNPDEPGATGASNLRASLERVLATRAPDTMAVQKYDIRGADGTFQTKYWSPKNIPLLSPTGEVRYILHRVEDVTDLVVAQERGEALQGRTREMEREVIARSQELAAANTELREANAKLGELDVAKTEFFSNVSHEFRTPLTLLLGPLEDLLADATAPLSADQRARLKAAFDNALRLLKLVNALLDFARLEAGRAKARYEQVDLSRTTAELAEMFRSATDRAGIRLTVDCPPLSETAWLDRDMWERIVPNLISNAFKFTLEGGIAVRVREDERTFVLEVSDTGSGIPAEELPKIFTRFHRVAGTAGRTYEGSGIGLSLVRELVELHGGRVSVQSPSDDPAFRTTFRIELPKGSAHLPANAVSLGHADRPVGRDAAAYAIEAARWARGSEETSPPSATPQTEPAEGASRAHVLVVDDNADLRDYLVSLLAPQYDVVAARDGIEALEAVHTRLPDLVVSDVMMPRLDGFGFVRRLRADAATAALPVILLSARSGEESAIEGLDSGSDDYLSKPFSARELLARVRTHLALAKLRREWSEELERANRDLEAYSYSVSHDLRAPLRHIRGYSELLTNEYASVLDAQGAQYVKVITDAVDHMSTLIDSLLALGRISRGPVHLETVDLSALATAAVAELRQAEPDRQIDVDIESGLDAQGDRRLLGIVMTNLLGNAWKYTGKTSSARIHCGRDRTAAVPTFFVRDNGAGFDGRYAKKIFVPFQRLHSARDFDGTGVGLATVQRVLARQGGKIWAEAEVGKGATFFFSLPAAPRAG